MSLTTMLLRGAALTAVLAGATAAQAGTYALVTINQQALFFNQINDGAKKAADAGGDKLVIYNANNVPSAQNDAIENYITQKVDGIVLVAIDVNGVKPAVTAAKKAGIPVIAVDAQIPDGDNVAFVGVDNAKAGEDIGTFFADYVKKNMGGKAKVGIVGALNSFIQNQRLDGFKKTASVPGVTFADTVDGQNVQDKALSASENLMTANPSMNAIYATGEPALIGAVSAVDTAAKKESSEGVRVGPHGPGHQGHRRGLGDRRRPAGPLYRGQGGHRVAGEDQEGRQGRCCDPRSRDHRHEGERRALQGDVQVGLTGRARMDAASAPAGPRVRMSGISKRYGMIQTLDDVTLEIWPGEVLGLVGDNGAGKSTLSKVLSGAVVPDSGTIEIDGKVVDFASPADARGQRVEMVYQDLSLCDTVDVAGNLFLGREPRRRILGIPFLDKKRMRRDADAMLRRLGISVPDITVHVENLSGGQRQSIAIGRAASFEPKVLIMDEPTAALAVAEVEAVLELIRNVSASGVSVILITHRLQDLFLVCDRIQVMYEGRAIAERRIEDTNIEDVVDLIVGRKFSARSARSAVPDRPGL